MELLKTFFPFSFGAKDKQGLITLIILFVIGVVICSVLGWLLGKIPVINIISGIVFWIAGLYLLVSLIIGILVFAGVLK